MQAVQEGDVDSGEGMRATSSVSSQPPILYLHLWRAWSGGGQQQSREVAHRRRRIQVDWGAIQNALINDVESAERAATYTDAVHDRMLLLHFVVALTPPVEVVRRIIELNPSAVVAKSGIGGLTPFMIACGRSAPRVVLRALLEHDDRAVLRVDSFGAAPIHWSCRADVDERVVKLILEMDPAQAVRSVEYSAEDDDVESEDDDDEEDDTNQGMLYSTQPLHVLAQQLEPSSPSLTPTWTRNQLQKVTYLLWARHYGSLASPRTRGAYSTLHAALAMAQSRPREIPAAVVDMAVRHHAQNSSGVRDLRGNLPLHYALSSCRSRGQAHELVTASHVQRILRAFPVAARTRDASGVLPLHRAIRCGRNWHSGGVKDVYERHPRAAVLRDPHDHLPTAFSAAVHNPADIDTSFSLLRAFPEVIYRHRQVLSTDSGCMIACHL